MKGLQFRCAESANHEIFVYFHLYLFELLRLSKDSKIDASALKIDWQLIKSRLFKLLFLVSDIQSDETKIHFLIQFVELFKSILNSNAGIFYFAN